MQNDKDYYEELERIMKDKNTVQTCNVCDKNIPDVEAIINGRKHHVCSECFNEPEYQTFITEDTIINLIS